MRFRKAVTMVAVASMTTALLGVGPSAVGAAEKKAADPDIGSLEQAALSAYLYTYPLVSVELTRRMGTTLDGGAPSGQSFGTAPMNELAHLPYVPDSSFTGVVRPNVDTMYTSMFYDVSDEPMVVNVPKLGDRYHLFQIMDMWTDVEGAPGTRTLDDAGDGYQFAIVGPNWRGTLPDGVHEYRMTTDSGWMIGRIQVNGADDVANVTALQTQLTSAPLSSYAPTFPTQRTGSAAPERPASSAAPETEIPMTAGAEKAADETPGVAEIIAGLTPQQYWDLYYTSLSHNQPRPEDRAFLGQLAKFGWSPHVKLDLDHMPERVRATWEAAWPKALDTVDTTLGGEPVNGWSIARSGIGDYGTDYAARAVVAHGGLGANLPEDAVYPVADVDSEGGKLSSEHSYKLHFAADEIPPVRAFWSLTMYNDKGFLVDNPINRYAVRGESLAKNPDGSIDIYIQSDNPGADKESNWLPAPSSGDFNVLLRLYWPEQEIIDGSWNPPAITKTS